MTVKNVVQVVEQQSFHTALRAIFRCLKLDACMKVRDSLCKLTMCLFYLMKFYEFDYKISRQI